MATAYILVDYENVQPRDVPLLDASRHRMIIFRGTHQNKVDADLAEALQPLGPNVEYVRVAKAGKNALDFQLAFQVGRLLERHATSNADREARFLIVSNDTGYSALLVHIEKLGYVAVQSANIRDGLAAVDPRSSEAHRDALAGALAHLRQGKNRPTTRQKLVHHLATHFKGNPEIDAEALVRSLEETGEIAVVGNKMDYSGIQQ